MRDDYSQEKNENFKAISIGFLLIIIIAAITFLKPYFNQTKVAEKTAENNVAARANIDFTKINKITSEELAKKIQTDSEFIVIDIRSESDYQKEHIIDSQNISLNRLSSAFNILDKNKTYVFIDETINIAAINNLANLLAEKKYQNIYYLDGGFADWKNKFNATISDGDPKSFVDQSKVSYIKSDDLKKILEQEKNLLLIDLRNSADFNTGHLPGAINIFLADLEKRKKEITVNKKIILYDSDGLSAFKGAVRLFDLGIFNVLALSDGFDSWNKKGYATVK
ncbi:MAG TPA: hypothetical protein DCS28_00770 [Candidatus Moranbacteria bacterium]|nr:hypothetical protein [Candidatus Moranbacteria bacterium]HAT74561.1 hypothetical protein [Candidatus Moranbacteria bacterium]